MMSSFRDALFWRSVFAEGAATAAFTYFVLAVSGLYLEGLFLGLSCLLSDSTHAPCVHLSLLATDVGQSYGKWFV